MPDILQTDNKAAGAEGDAAPPVPRSYAIQRLQIGFAGLAAMVLMVGLASVVMEREGETELAMEPEPGETAIAEADAPVQNDPLADAGLVPDLPAEPEPEAEGGTPAANISPPAEDGNEQ